MPETAESALAPAAAPARAGFWAVGRFDERANYSSWRPGGASSWLLMVADAGGGIVEQGGCDLRLGAGDAVLLGPGVRQFYGTDPGPARWRFWWVHFWMHSGWQPWLTGIGTPPQRAAEMYPLPGIDGALHAELDATFRRAHAHARWPGHGVAPEPSRATLPAVTLAGSPPARELADGDVGQILLLLCANVAGGQPASAGEDPRVERVRALIRADPSAPHTVAGLAAAVALSPSRLAHVFRERTGHAPMHEVRLARLEYAARLLESTALGVAEVATASGFASPFHFSRAFATRFGLPPRDYRRAGWQTSGRADSDAP